jgi:hypothetical protein
MLGTGQAWEPVPKLPKIAMPRLLPSDKCPKCAGPLKRQSTPLGTLYACEKCDADDPMKASENWLSGELRKPK